MQARAAILSGFDDGSSGGGGVAEGGTLADRLNRLFAAVRRRGGAEYGNTAVAQAITERGVPISHTYIWQLRTGRRDNPTIQHLSAIAEFFGVPVAYFFDGGDSARDDRDLELLVVLRKQGVDEIALRVADLSEGSRDAVRGLVDRMWELEHRNGS